MKIYNSGNECAICFEEYTIKEKCVLECGHEFCSKCPKKNSR
jgi:rRNA maturation protein Nop10